MPTRRQFLLAAALTPAAQAFAQTKLPPVLVEIINFQCPRCREVNDHYDRIKAAADKVGMRFVFAPVAWEGQSLWPDRVYYTVRDLYPNAESLVRSFLFDAIQREGQRLEELPQVISFFERRQLVERMIRQDPGTDYSQMLLAIADQANTDTPLLSEVKAGRLANMSGATEVPVFVWVADGEVTHTISPADAQEALPLIAKVIRHLEGKS